MSQKKTTNQKSLTDRLLEHARDSHTPLSLYLVSGFQLKGEIVEYDSESVLINHKNVHQVVMRTSISTMYTLAGSPADADRWWRPDTDGDAAAS